tara:strand:- start:415 stop:1536 length:1122 start_codon:yes stop_codon:yes gene_type:complete
MAGLIYEIFQKGVDVLAMQEVPPANSTAFEILKKELMRLDSQTNLIDIEAFKKSCRITEPHLFCTAMLHNPAKIALKQGVPISQKDTKGVSNNRGQIFSVMNHQSGLHTNIANLHGDFMAQQQTYDFVKNFKGIALGDMNVNSQILASINNPNTLHSIESPVTIVDGTVVTARTDDMICDNFSRKVKPDFDPSTMALPQVAQANHGHKVLIPSSQAQQHLVEFKKYVILVGRRDLIDANDHIKGIKLTTPKGGNTTNIIISNKKVLKAYRQFQNYQLIKSHCDVLHKELKATFVMNRDRKEMKYEKMKALMEKMINSGGSLEMRDIQTLKGNSVVTAGILSGGFFKNRTDNLLNMLSKNLKEEEAEFNPSLKK